MKLSALTIIVIGISIGIISLSFAMFYHYMPNTTEMESWIAYRNDLDKEARKREQAIRRVQQAMQLRDQKVAEWQAIVAVKTPPPSVRTGGIDLGVPPYQLVLDARTYRDSLQRAVNAQLLKGGVRLPAGGPLIPIPEQNQQQILANFFNYPAIAYPVVIQNLGQITVQGTYEQIKAHVRSWKDMPNYLAVTDALNITGTSPTLTATYNVVIVGFIQATRIHPPSPEGGGPIQAAAAPPGGGGGGGAAGPAGTGAPD